MKSSLKFTTIALLLGGVLNMPCLNAASADEVLEEPSPAPILSRFAHSEAGMAAFAQFANENAAQKEIRATLATEVAHPDSFPLSFFTGAFAQAEAGKNLISFLVGVKTQSLDSLAARSASQARIAALEEELRLATTSLTAERGTLKLTISAPLAVVVTPEELPAFLVINPAKRTLRDPSNVAETVSVLAVRAALGTPDLPRVLSTLEAIETHLKHVVADAKGDELTTAVARVHSFATLRSQLSVMAPRIHEFLMDHTNSLMQTEQAGTNIGYLGRLTATRKFTLAQRLLNAENRAGQNIALCVYDEIFQSPALAGVTVPPQTSTNRRSTNELLAALLAIKPTQTEAIPVVAPGVEPYPRTFDLRIIASVIPMVISADGLVLDIGSTGTVNAELTPIRGKTREFLSWAMGARTVVGSQGLQGFETAELARTSLAPVVAPPSVVIKAAGGAATSHEPSAVLVAHTTDAPISTGDAVDGIDGGASVALQQPLTTDASAS
jgi:hypothetical protein